MRDYDYETVPIYGREFRVELERDWDSTPFDADCYDAEDIDAWREDSWEYVTVVVTLLGADDEPTEFYDALSGVEFGYAPGFKSEHLPNGRIGWQYIVNTRAGHGHGSDPHVP